MSEYNPREYWPARLEREGKRYVSTRNRDSIYEKQGNVFWNALEGIFPSGKIESVLDFGCGVGRFSERIANKVERYVGVDINAGAFQYAPKLANGEFVPLPEDRLPFPDAEFDGALSITVLQHIVDPALFQTWASELGRVVKPGGFFLIIDDADTKVKMSPHMCVRGPETIAEALGSSLEYSRILDAERPKSHYCFVARKAK